MLGKRLPDIVSYPVKSLAMRVAFARPTMLRVAIA